MQALPPKKEVALALLERSSVFIHLDPRQDAVRVPPWFKKQPQLVLQVGLNMAVPIRDLEVDDDAISCTLSFSRSPHFCFLPWSAIYALVGDDGRGMVWPEDVPAEVAAQANQKGAQQQSPRKKAHLRAVSDEDDTGAEAPSHAEAAEPAPAAEGDAGPTDAVASPAVAAPPARASRKKASSAKPSLAAVPAAADVKPEPAAQAATPSAETEGSGDLQQPAVTETAAGSDKPEVAKQADAGSEGKRKLPPYLRIVK